MSSEEVKNEILVYQEIAESVTKKNEAISKHENGCQKILQEDYKNAIQKF